MGLWLKCPKCQASNPLSLKACASCGASLENLSQNKRVYMLTPPGSAPPEPEAKAKPPKPKAPAKPAAPKAKATKTKKEAAKPEAAKPTSRGWEAEGPPPKRAKGPKAAGKKKGK
jgi:hypothetical protein